MVEVKKIMRKDICTLSRSSTIAQAITKLSKNPETSVVITDSKKIVGIVTGTDILKVISDKKYKLSGKVSSIMSSPVTTIRSDATLEKANKIMDSKNVSNYPIVEDGAVIGVVTQSDVVHAINDNMKFHRNIQNAVILVFLAYAFGIILFYTDLVGLFF